MITSKRLGYGMCVLYELATRPTGYHSARDIAEGYRVPEAFVRRILLDLRRAGIVTAQKGRTGGYQLAHPLEKISLDQVFNTLEPNPPGVVYGRQRGGGYHVSEDCPVAAFWRDLEDRFIQAIAGSTLADVVTAVRSRSEAAVGKKRRRKAAKQG